MLDSEHLEHAAQRMLAAGGCRKHRQHPAMGRIEPPHLLPGHDLPAYAVEEERKDGRRDRQREQQRHQGESPHVRGTGLTLDEQLGLHIVHLLDQRQDRLRQLAALT